LKVPEVVALRQFPNEVRIAACHYNFHMRGVLYRRCVGNAPTKGSRANRSKIKQDFFEGKFGKTAEP
jgi:hypothetical protein